MKALYTLLFVAFSVGLGACASQVPSVEKRPPSVERKMWVAQHWEEIADHVAQRLGTALAASHSQIILWFCTLKNLNRSPLLIVPSMICLLRTY